MSWAKARTPRAAHLERVPELLRPGSTEVLVLVTSIFSLPNGW
jgi:hypothetical protein